MRHIKKLLGKIIYQLTRAHVFILEGLASLIESGVLLAKSFLKGCIVLISMGGCLVIFLLIGPVGGWLFTHPWVLGILLLIMIFPILGAASVSFLTYFKTVSSQYLFHLANCLQDPEHYRYQPYKYYKQAYRQAEEDRARRERARRDRQQRAWEDRFRQWQQGGATGARTEANPYTDFKGKFEKYCGILGVPFTSDQYKIKLAYRRKAKMYHPDLNKNSDATRQFQIINEAYEFLNEDNIRRYRNMG